MGYLNNDGLGYLWQSVKNTLTTKQDSLTGTPGQVVGFDARGAAAAQDGWSNQNLLDNWYFTDPIHQRGQTSYTATGYTIDRWRIANGALTTDPSSKTLRLENIDGDISRNCFFQLLESPWLFAGKTLTFSVLCRDLHGTLTATAYANAGDTAPFGAPISRDGLASVTFTMENDIVPTQFRVHWLLSPGGSCVPVAAKLELGKAQTLAHQDAAGDWVLNDPPPSRALELTKCRRHYQIFPDAALRPTKAWLAQPPLRADPALGSIQIDGKTYYTADADL